MISLAKDQRANDSKAILRSVHFTLMHFSAFPVLVSYFLHDVNEAQVVA